MRRGLLPLVCVFASTLFVTRATADDAHPATLLPPSTALYVEIPRPAALFDTVYAHPVAQQIIASPPYQQALESAQLLPLWTGVAVVEFGMQMKWPEIVAAITEGGVAVAIDGNSDGRALLVRARDAETLTKFRNVILNLTRDQAKKAGSDAEIKQAEYRGIQAYEANGTKFATFDRWLVVTNKDEFGQQILDQYLDKSSQDLAASEAFQQARAAQGDSVAAWGYINVEQLRSKIPNQDNPLVSGKPQDPGGEILVGGVLANLHRTPYVSAALQLDGDHLRLTVQSPHDPAWVGEQREYFFGPDGSGKAPRPLEVPHLIGAVSAYRDFAGMWVRAGDLFSKEINDKFAEAEATLATLFSGRDFGEDILGAIEPNFQLLVTRQTFADSGPVPTIKLPSFAVIAQLKEPESMRGEFRRMFQNLVGFLNIVGAMNGQPQLDLGTEEVAGHKLITASYVPDVDQRPGAQSRINFNFSPTVGFVDTHVILSSTTQLARAISEKLAKPEGDDGSLDVNTYAQLHAPALREVLQDNFGQLLAQNVLNEGHSHEQAEKEIQGLLDIVTLFQQATMSLAVQDQLRLTVDLQFASPRAP